MSITWLWRFMNLIFLISLISTKRFLNSRSIALSGTYFILRESNTIQQDCHLPRLRFLSTVLRLLALGAFISQTAPSIRQSAVCLPFLSVAFRNSTVCPQRINALAVSSSCGQTLTLSGIIILPVFFILGTLRYTWVRDDKLDQLAISWRFFWPWPWRRGRRCYRTNSPGARSRR